MSEDVNSPTECHLGNASELWVSCSQVPLWEQMPRAITLTPPCPA